MGRVRDAVNARALSLARKAVDLSVCGSYIRSFPRKKGILLSTRLARFLSARMAEVSLAQATCKFIDECPTPFHLCAETGALLKAAGFTEIAEDGAWRPLLKPGGSYFYTRAGTTLVAFHVGAAFEAGNGINVVGGHTDSPVLKLKPSSKKSAHGYLQLNVETYGGGLWHTWFDRELTLAGSVIVKQADGSFARRLLFVRRPLMRVPQTLPRHLPSPPVRPPPSPTRRLHVHTPTQPPPPLCRPRHVHRRARWTRPRH